MPQPISHSPRRRWPLILVVLAFVSAGLWAAFWYFAAGKAEATIAEWREREAKSGRIFTCATQTISGFPFRIQMRCDDADIELRSNQPPLAFKAKGIVVVSQLWRPTVLSSEFIAPLTVAEMGQPATMTTTWRRAQTEVHGLPVAPERGSIALDDPVVDRTAGGANERLFKAARLEFDARLVSGSVQSSPVIESVLKLVGGTAPSWHPAAATPVDADVTAVLRGLKDLAPKSWQQRLRELQAAGGRIEVTSARVQQGETIAVANGVLGLSASGRLDGQLRLTVANLDKFLPTLGLDRMLTPQAAPNQLNEAFGALDRIMPGLGNVARQNAGPAIIAGVNMMGQQTELEGKRAVMLPLRFTDGAVSLGPLQLGQTPPLF